MTTAIDPGLESLRDRVRTAAAAGTPLCICGGGTKGFYGEAPTGELLDTRVYAGIIDYEPSELVLTARAGTGLAAIEGAMRGRGQMLGFEPPHFGAGGTLGGAVAAGLSGPRRPYTGSVRDFLLGVRIVDGSGADLSFGGRVMKNVAGFDVTRLTAGALGTLGLIAEVSLKCLPLPKAEASLAFECSADESIRMTNEWAAQPLPMSATFFHRGVLTLRLSGAEPAVAAARAKLGGSPLADAAAGAFWTSVRDQLHPAFVVEAPGTVLWRLSVRSTAPYTDLGGEQAIEWGGALRWLVAGERTDPVKVRTWAAAQGGHATLFRAPDKSSGVFQPLPATLAALHRRVKAVFDPQGICNRGRLYPEF